MSRIILIFGTRPEFIKLIPVVIEFRKQGWGNRLKLIFTHQHDELIEPLFNTFNIFPDVRLNKFMKNCTLRESIHEIMHQLEEYFLLNVTTSDYIIAQGDTTSCFCAARTAFYKKSPFAHIEAGLRTYHISQPFPEELFRRIISKSAAVHFAPTPLAVENLLQENFKPDTILLTGNTIVDTIKMIHENEFLKKVVNSTMKPFLNSNNNVLITLHRRENQGQCFDSVTTTVSQLAKNHPHLNFIWLSHPAPAVAFKLAELNKNCPANIHILPPIEFIELYSLYPLVKLILTDSGGIQEEAISFGIPVIVLREATERQESLITNCSILTGTDPIKITMAFETILKSKFQRTVNPYGDGFASQRIVEYFNLLDVRKKYFQLQKSLPLHSDGIGSAFT